MTEWSTFVAKATTGLLIRKSGGLLAQFQISPLRGRWMPMMRLGDAIEQAYDRMPAIGDKWQEIHGISPLLGYGYRFLEMARAGEVQMFGSRIPSGLLRPIPRSHLRPSLLKATNFNRMRTHDGIEWHNLAVRRWDFGALLRNIRRIDFSEL